MNTVTTIRTESDAREWLAENGIAIPELTEGCIVLSDACGRCGGGGFGPWRPDGGRCYDCGGANTRARVRRIPLKRWAQLQKAAVVRHEKKAALAIAAHERTLEGQRNWCAANGYGRVTFEERDAAVKAAKAAKAAGQKHVGEVGKRSTFSAVIVAIPTWENAFGTVHCHLMEDEAGNVIVWKSGTVLRLGEVRAEKGDRVTFVATVKEHGEREGVKQTLVTRARATELVKAAGSIAA